MEKPKFKVGDMVKCVGDFDLKTISEKGQIDLKKIGVGWKKDLIFEIKEIYDGICWGGNDGSGVFEERLIKVDKQLTIE